jgi:hypothetical protein
MHEFKHGELKRGRGGKVKNPRQAIAIALSEAGASNQQSSQENRRRLHRTKRKERLGQTAQAEKEGQRRARRTLADTKGKATRSSSAASSRKRRGAGKTRAELYRQASRRNIHGRSRMTKAELERALHH